jgi:hypothetical protein
MKLVLASKVAAEYNMLSQRKPCLAEFLVQTLSGELRHLSGTFSKGPESIKGHLYRSNVNQIDEGVNYTAFFKLSNIFNRTLENM